MTQSARIADELAKLGDLYKSGAMSEDEFRAYKAKLLSAPEMSAVAPSRNRWVTRRTTLLIGGGLLVGTLGALIPPPLPSPRHKFGGMFGAMLYGDLDFNPLKYFFDNLFETLAAFAVLFLVAWLVVRRFSSPIVVGILCGVAYALIRFVFDVLAFTAVMGVLGEEYAKASVQRILTNLWVGGLVWAASFALLAYLIQRFGAADVREAQESAS